MTHRRATRSRGDKYPLWPVWIVCGLIGLGFVIGVSRLLLDQRPKTSDIAAVEVPGTSELRFHAGDFPAGELRMFRISGTGITVVMKRLADRRVHAGLSNCTVCSRQGHHSSRVKDLLVKLDVAVTDVQNADTPAKKRAAQDYVRSLADQMKMHIDMCPMMRSESTHEVSDMNCMGAEKQKESKKN